MLNRRSLRIKAMQAVYAFKQAERSHFLLSLDHIAETFAPDLNSMQVQDLKKLEGSKKLATLLFQESYQKKVVDLSDENLDGGSTEIAVTVTNLIDQYHTQIKKERQFFLSTMLSEVEKIYDRYLLILVLMTELAELAKEDEEERREKQTTSYAIFSGDLNLYTNQVIQALREYKPMELEIIKRGVGWGNDRSLLNQVYRDVLKNDAVYLDYIKLADPTLEDDKKILNHILKNTVLKQELLRTYFEEADINWEENSEIIKSMVGKTIKSVGTETEEVVELMSLSKNWEDDRDFFKELYIKTLDNDEYYEKLIVDKIKNWDAERVAMLDKIILKMAITEMLNFSSIPVKVTINEYIELSKVYSTPKSRQFVNGILDVIALELSNNGQIKKSGRGLIDNK